MCAALCPDHLFVIGLTLVHFCRAVASIHMHLYPESEANANQHCCVCWKNSKLAVEAHQANLCRLLQWLRTPSPSAHWTGTGTALTSNLGEFCSWPHSQHARFACSACNLLQGSLLQPGQWLVLHMHVWIVHGQLNRLVLHRRCSKFGASALFAQTNTLRINLCHVSDSLSGLTVEC